MKGRVVAIGGFLTVIYLSAIFTAALHTQKQRCGAAANEEEHTHAVSRSKGKAFKTSPKTPGELLTQNKRLSDKLSALLGQQNPPVTDLQVASQGSKILAQFVSTVHVSENLVIPFDRLKSQEQTSGSLAGAIHVLKPDADVKTELRIASMQAVADLEESYWAIAVGS